MVEINGYMERLLGLLREKFGERLAYVGLQGSYSRGEAAEDSDVDVMVLLEDFSVDDMQSYRALLDQMGDTDRACGFLCGREEMANWNPLEICHLLHTTRDYYGELNGLVSAYTRENVRDYIRLSLGNLYHVLCHTRVHAGEAEMRTLLPAAYKQAFFILQNLCFYHTGCFPGTRRELRTMLDGADRAVLQREMERRGTGDWNTHGDLRLLFDWCRDTLNRFKE